MFESYSVYANVHRHQRSCTLPKLGYDVLMMMYQILIPRVQTSIFGRVREGQWRGNRRHSYRRQKRKRSLLGTLGHALQEIARKMG